MTKYVAGFLFNDIGSMVALIEKQKPEWQKGCWNAIGGKIEEGESPLKAMRREFEEETGVALDSWKRFVTLQGNGWEVHFFSAYSTEALQRTRTTTDETVSWFWAKSGPPKEMANLRWLINMALGMKNERAAEFVVSEFYA